MFCVFRGCLCIFQPERKETTEEVLRAGTGALLWFRFALAQSLGGIEPGRALQNLVAD
jgi:hypothetical protein